MIADEHSAQAYVSELPGCDALAWERLTRFERMLREESLRQNLVAQPSLDHLWQRHITDSAQLLEWSIAGTWIDLGSGAGFPGLVAAILRSETPVILVESRTKRVDWLGRVVTELGLINVTVNGCQIHQVDQAPAGVISARALAPLQEIVRLAERFSTATTQWILPKGRSAWEELAALSGWRHTFHVEQSLTSPDAGIIVGHLLGREHT